MSGPGYESGMFKPGDKAKDGSVFLGETDDGSPLWAEPSPGWKRCPHCLGSGVVTADDLRPVVGPLDKRGNQS